MGSQQYVYGTGAEVPEARALRVRQRAGLFGVIAVYELALAIIAPFIAQSQCKYKEDCRE